MKFIGHHDMQADGSAMYSLPAFWSMAREGADVVMIIANNASYAILQAEFDHARLGPPGGATKAIVE